MDIRQTQKILVFTFQKLNQFKFLTYD